MSYISKIFLKKMFPADCCKVEDDYIKVTVTNVISNLDIQKLPEDGINNHFEILDENDTVLAGKGNEDAWEKFKVEFNGTVYDKDNYQDVVGTIVEKGQKYTVWLPNPGWSAGETHKLTVKLYQDRPIEFFINVTLT